MVVGMRQEEDADKTYATSKYKVPQPIFLCIREEKEWGSLNIEKEVGPRSSRKRKPG